MAGEITMSVRYNPWGKPIETNGIGNFESSFIGTLIDATTGLIYVGNGQYYDPETGRFLTRGVNPNGTNPYVPFDPTSLLIAPLGLMAVYYGSRKSKKSAPYALLLVFMVILPVSIGLACVETAPAPATTTPEVSSTPITTPVPVTEPAILPPPASTPTETPSGPAECVNCPPTSSPMPTASPNLNLYGIVLEGGWNENEQINILAAVKKIGEEFVRLGVVGGTSWDAFKNVYGEGVLFYREGRSGAGGVVVLYHRLLNALGLRLDLMLLVS